MKCNNCNSEICEKALFCCQCGSKIESTDTNSNSMKVWEKKYYVDEFQQPTDKWYVTTTEIVNGLFSNGVSQNEKLSIISLIDASYAAFKLFKWGRTLENNIFDKENTYSLVVLKKDGSKEYFNGYMYGKGDRIVVRESSMFISLLESEKDSIKVFIELQNSAVRQQATYLFDLPTKDFAEIFES